MKQLSKLQSLVEAAGAKKSSPVSKMLLKLEDDAEKAFDAVEKIRTQLESQVMTDYFKTEGFPATESKGAKTAANRAFDALKQLENELLDLIQSVAMHDNPEDFDH